MIWSRDNGQRIPCFDRCQLTITLMSNIKAVCCKLATVSTGVIYSSMSSKLDPVIWLRDTGHIGIHGGAEVRTDVLDAMAMKQSFLASMAYHIFLTTVRRRNFQPIGSDFTKVFQPKNYTTGFGKDKEKDCGSLDGILSVKIAEKVRLFS